MIKLSARFIRIAKTWGQFLGLMSLGYVVYVIWPELSGFDRQQFNVAFIIKILLIIAILSLSSLCLAIAWSFLLQFALKDSICKPTAIARYAVTQINKYLPGNVFHFVSRYVISKDEKTAHASLVFATTLELLSVATSASIVALVASEFSPSEHRYAKYAEIFLVAIAVGLFAIILATLKKPSFRSEWPSLALGFLGHLSYILIMSFGFHSLVITVAPTSNISLALSIFGCSLSWFIGFIVPGLPAGIGLRELVVLEVLRNALDGSEVAMITILFRIITMSSDVMLFAIGSILLYLNQMKKGSQGIGKI